MSNNVRFIETQCPMCQTQDTLYVSEHGYLAWQTGTVIQLAFPELSATQREQLISGICGPCWDKSFGED